MKHISILIVSMLVLSLGCAPKNSIEEGPSQEGVVQQESPMAPESQEAHTEMVTQGNIPAQSFGDISAKENSGLAEVQGNTSEPSSPHLYEDATPAPPASEVPSVPARIGIGLAWMAGGFLVLHVGGGIEAALFRLNAVYSQLLPTMKLEAQLKIGESILNSASRMAQKLGLKSQIAERLVAKLIVTRSATGLAVKKGLSSVLGKAVGLAKWAAPFMWGMGVMQMVLEPTELGGEGDEIGPKERFEFLKENIEALEKDPHNLKLQDQVIYSTVTYLYDFIEGLKRDYDHSFYALEEFQAREDISDGQRQEAQKEFEAFDREHRKIMEYFEEVYQCLVAIYYNDDKTEVDRQKAETILRTSVEKIDKIFETKEEL